MLNYCLDIDSKSRWFFTTQTPTAKSFPFFLEEAGDFFAGPGYFTERSELDGYLLLFTLSGRGRLQMEGQGFDLHKNSVVLIHEMVQHRYEAISAEPWNLLWLRLSGEGVAAYEKYINEGKIDVYPVEHPDELTQGFETAFTLAQQNTLASFAEISNLISSLLTKLLISRLQFYSGVLPDCAAPIHAAAEYIENHYPEDIAVDDIAKLVHLSKFHFIRTFKKQMGTSPYDYLLYCRIHHAKQFLCTTELSISAISSRVGFQSQSNFISHFRMLTGMTPSKFRKSSLNLPAGNV